MKITKRKDGTIRITVKICDYDLQSNMSFLSDDYISERDVQVGDEGCLSLSYNIRDTSKFTDYRAILIDSPEGIGGNINSSIKRLHGWRGTSNNISRSAEGWRRVKSVEPRKQGQGWTIILSKDLKPEENKTKTEWRENHVHLFGMRQSLSR